MRSEGSGKLSPAVKRSLGALVVLLVVAIALTAWYFVAQERFDRVAKATAESLGALADLHDAVFDGSGVPKNEVTFQAGGEYVRGFEDRRSGLEATASQLMSGEGFGFWLPDKRASLAGTIKARIESEQVLVTGVRDALAAVQSLNSEVMTALAEARSGRAAAVAALTPEADVDTFRSHEQVLARLSQAQAASRKRVKGAANNNKLVDLAEQVRLSLLRSLLGHVAREGEAIRLRRDATAQARVELVKHKETLAGMMQSTSGFLSGLNLLGSTLLPAAQRAYQETDPLRRLIREAEEPIPGGEVAAVVSMLFGGKRGREPVSPLSLVCDMDPTFKATVELLKGVCTGVETVHGEVSAIVNATQPVVGPVDGFLSARSRSAMLTLARVAPDSAGFFESKTGVFDPVLQQIQSLRPYVEAVHQLAYRIMIPQARQIITQCADTANRLLDYAEAPFQQGRSAIIVTAATLKEVGRSEESYLAALRSLQTEKPPQIAAADTLTTTRAGTDRSEAIATTELAESARSDSVSTPAGGNSSPENLAFEVTVSAVGQRLAKQVAGHTFVLVFVQQGGLTFSTVEFDGQSYDLYDAPHGMGRNQIDGWEVGRLEDFSSNQYSGQKYPFTCRARLLDAQKSASEAYESLTLAIELGVAGVSRSTGVGGDEASAFAARRTDELKRVGCPGSEFGMEEKPSSQVDDFTGDGVPDVSISYVCAVGASSVEPVSELWVRIDGEFRDVFQNTKLSGGARFLGDGIWEAVQSEWGPDDAHCCPSWKVVSRFRVAASSPTPTELSTERVSAGS